MPDTLVLQSGILSDFKADQKIPSRITDTYPADPPQVQLGKVTLNIKNHKKNFIRLAAAIEWYPVASLIGDFINVVFEIRRDDPYTGEIVYSTSDCGVQPLGEYTFITTAFEHIDEIPESPCRMPYEVSYYLVATNLFGESPSVSATITEPITFIAEQIEEPVQITHSDFKLLP